MNIFANQKGISILAILIIIISVAVVIGGGFLLLNQERAKTRDAKRLSDMQQIHAAFALMYNETASYAGAAENGCSEQGALLSSCNLSAYVPNIATLQDPGANQYVVTQVPSDDTYQIRFTLEKSYGNLAAGNHAVSPTGIR